MIRRLSLLALLVAALAAPLAADARERHHRRAIPEFDPATVGSIAAIVVGGVVLVSRRRKR